MDTAKLYSPADSRTDPRVNSLRLLFRHLLHFRSLRESDGVIEITAPNGARWALDDLEYLYDMVMRRPLIIPPRRLPVAECEGYFALVNNEWVRVTKVKVLDKGKGKTETTLTFTYPPSPEGDVRPDTERRYLKSGAQLRVMTPWEKRRLEVDRRIPCLPLRQQEAIKLFLVLNMEEKDAALTMGLSATNPVGMYATAGLTKLLTMMDRGQLVRFRDIDPLMFSVA